MGEPDELIGVRHTLTVLPLADGLTADVELFGQVLLGHALFFAALDQFFMK